MAQTNPLDPDKIKANLKTTRIGKKIVVYNRTSSTNDIAAEYAKNKENDGLAIFAEEQTAGRGRAGTKWYSGRADSILCSVVLTDSKCNAELLSLACAVAVAEAIGKTARFEAKIKWPNDVIHSRDRDKLPPKKRVFSYRVAINRNKYRYRKPDDLRQGLAGEKIVDLDRPLA
jgi:biotin-(acetyl-CoA carboxylase) ligase